MCISCLRYSANFLFVFRDLYSSWVLFESDKHIIEQAFVLTSTCCFYSALHKYTLITIFTLKIY